MYLLVNGSPKGKNSNSLYFLNNIGSNIQEYHIHNIKSDSYENLIKNINSYHTIVLAFPLYVDSPPSIVLDFLNKLISDKVELSSIGLYTIINCGFREGEQNITALNIIKRWCSKVNITYNGSILIGAGEIVGKPKYKIISNKALKQLKQFALNISNNIKTEDIITTMDILGNKSYCALANFFWNKKGRRNNLTKLAIKEN